jgi:hypothetical protein
MNKEEFSVICYDLKKELGTDPGEMETFEEKNDHLCHYYKTIHEVENAFHDWCINASYKWLD